MRVARGLLVVAVVCAATAAYWQWLVIAPVRLPQPVGRWNQDLFTLYYPTYVVAYRGPQLLPAWNPYQLAGTPLLAGYVCGLFYPSRLLGIVLPPHLAIGWGTAFDLALGGLFMLACARRLGLGWAAGALATVACVLHGWISINWLRPSYFAGLMWVPAVFLAAATVVRRPSVRAGVLLGVAVACQFLTGHVQIVCYTAYGVAVAVVADLLQRRRHEALRIGAIAGAGLLAAVTVLGLTAVQLLPTLELLEHATRRTLTLQRTEPQTPSFLLLRDVVFAGGPAVLLAPVALASRRWTPLLAPALSLAAFALLIGLGTPLYTHVFFPYVPGGNLFRWPQTIDSLAAFALALLAGAGLEAARQDAWSRPRRLFAAGGALALALVSPAAMRGWTIAVVAGTLVLLALKSSRGRTAIAWLIVACVVGERATHPNRLMMPQNLPASYFAPPPAVEVLRARAPSERVLMVKNWQNRWPFTEMMGSAFGLRVVQDYEPLAPEAYQAFLRPLGGNVDEPLFWGRFHASPLSPGWRLLDLLAVRHVVMPARSAWGGERVPRFRRVYEDAEALVYENTRALPRVRLVGHWRSLPDAAAALAAVQHPRFDPWTQAVVEGVVAPPAIAGADGPPGSATIVVDEAERVDVAVEAARPALLVLADLYFPGWRVEVDGVERPLLRTDYLLRGVQLEAGAHRVRFRYAPASLRLGAATSAVTVLVLVGALLRRLARGAA